MRLFDIISWNGLRKTNMVGKALRAYNFLQNIYCMPDCRLRAGNTEVMKPGLASRGHVPVGDGQRVAVGQVRQSMKGR